MPLIYVRDDARRRVTVTAIGDITLNDAISILDRRVIDGVWAYALLYDGRQRTSVMDPQEVRILVELTRTLSSRHGHPGPMAVVRQDTGGYGTARMFGILSEEASFQVSVFRTIEEAEAWLDSVLST